MYYFTVNILYSFITFTDPNIILSPPQDLPCKLEVVIVETGMISLSLKTYLLSSHILYYINFIFYRFNAR